MYAIRQWNPSRKRTADGWLDAFVLDLWVLHASGGFSNFLTTPLFSLRQGFEDLAFLLEGVGEDVRPKTAEVLAEELRVRLEDSWLARRLPFETSSLRTELTNPASVREPVLRENLRLSLGAMCHALDGFDWCGLVLDDIDKLVDSNANFSVVEASVAELQVRLLELGHSELGLQEWVLKHALRHDYDAGPGYLDALEDLCTYASVAGRPYRVLLSTSIGNKLPDSATCEFADQLPAEFQPLPTAVTDMANAVRYCVVTCSAKDYYAAADVAKDLFRRHLDVVLPSRMLVARAPGVLMAVRDSTTGQLHGYRDEWTSVEPDNESFAQALAGTSKASETLDRVHYWVYQGIHAQGHAQLVAHWTALEFYFSGGTADALELINRGLPPYLCLRFLRDITTDWWRLVRHSRAKLPYDLYPLIANPSVAKPDLERLLVALRAPDADRMRQTLVTRPSAFRYSFIVGQNAPEHPTCRLGQAFADIHQRVRWDLNTLYRTRNLLVHDAPRRVVRHRALLDRLSFFLLAAFDGGTWLASRNAGLAVADLHQAFALGEKRVRADLAAKTLTDRGALFASPAYTM